MLLNIIVHVTTADTCAFGKKPLGLSLTFELPVTFKQTCYFVGEFYQQQTISPSVASGEVELTQL